MKKILIIDDDKNIAELIAEHLKNSGYITKTLYDSKNVFEEVKNFKPNLITLDLNMPEPNGFKLLTDLKNNQETAGIPILIISSMADGLNNDIALRKSEGVLCKPFTFTKLIHQVETILL